MNLITPWIYYVLVMGLLVVDVVFILRRVFPVYAATVKARNVVGQLQRDASDSDCYSSAWSTMNKVRFYNLESYTHQIVTMLFAFSLSSWLWLVQANGYLQLLALLPWMSLGLILCLRWFLDYQYGQVSEAYLKGLLKTANPFEHDGGHPKTKMSAVQFARIPYKSIS